MKNLLNKGLLVKVMCGMLVVTMVGCYSKGAEEQQEQAQVTTPVEEPVGPVRTENDTEEPEEQEAPVEEYEATEDDSVIEDEYIKPEEQDVPSATKEEIAEALEYTIASTMGSDYCVEVYMYDENTCRIGIMVNNFSCSYGELTTDEIADLCELYGVTDNCAGVAINAEAAFEKAGYNVKVNVVSMDCLGTAFMMVDSTGYAIYY